jgi:hypothetical protein
MTDLDEDLADTNNAREALMKADHVLAQAAAGIKVHSNMLTYYIQIDLVLAHLSRITNRRAPYSPEETTK